VKTFSCFHFAFEPTATEQDFVNQQNSLNESEQFCRDEYAGLYRYAWALLGNKDDALETVQESFLRFHRMWREGAIREHDRALLFRLARNVAIDRQRRTHTTQRLQPDNLIPFPRTPEELLLEKEAEQIAVQALSHLSEKEQECLALRCGGLSYGEVAQVLQLSVNSIGPMMARALRRFRQKYEEILENKDGQTRFTGRR
jgi:RNA polymerase sigma-70 factor (ECF subfamily)